MKVKFIWNNQQVSEPVFQGFTFGGLKAAGTFVKANYPGLRAVRVGDTVTLAKDIPDSTSYGSVVELWY